MINTFKNNPVLFCIFSVTAALLSYVIITKIQQPVIATHAPSAQAQHMSPEQFAAQVDMLMTNTWNQLQADAGVTIHDCQTFLDQYADELKHRIEEKNKQRTKNFSAISQPTKTLIQEILIDFNINPTSIKLVPYDGHGSPAAADDYTMYIDEKNLKTFCPEAQRFVIAHEISHFLNKDNSLESAITNLIDTDNKVHNHCLDSFARSTEFRADMNALQKGPQYTQGAIAFFKELINRYGDDDSPTHPRPSDRLKIAQDMAIVHTKLGNQALKTA